MSRLLRWTLTHPRILLLCLAGATVVLATGLPRLRTDLGYRAFLGADHPSVKTFDGFLDRFGGGLPMRAVYSCEQTERCTSVFDVNALEMARDVAEQLSKNPAIDRVISPANALIFDSVDRGGGRFAPMPRKLVENASVVSDRAHLVELALADHMWVGDLISGDAQVGSVVIELTSSDSAVASDAYAALDEVLAPLEAEGWVFHRVGGPIEFVVAGGELDAAMARIVPVMVALIAVALILLFRSLTVAVVALASTGIAVLWTHGALGWIGWAQNSLSQTLAPLILVIGVCDGIHLVARYLAHCREEPPQTRDDRRELLHQASLEIFRPCCMTSVTTAAGFLSFATAGLVSFAQYGAIAAIGVLTALVLTFSLLPVTLLYIPIGRLHAPKTSTAWQHGLEKLVRVACRRRVPILIASALLLILCGGGMSRLRVDSTFDELYGEQSRVVMWSHFVADHLRKPDTLEVDLELGPNADITSAATLEVIRDIQNSLASIVELEGSRSLLDHSLGAQALDGGKLEETLSRWISQDRRHVRISFDADKLPQDVMRRVLHQVHAHLRTGLPKGWSASVTGPLALVHDMVDAMQDTQARSFAGAAVAVFVLLTIYLRSLRWALLAMLPTTLPVVMTLGVMGLLDIPLDIGSSMVAAVVLGIAVDDIVHLLDQFRERRGRGETSQEAIQNAMKHVGQALVSTSLALTVGFAALTLSPWASVTNFGAISAVAILGALASAIVLLPALLGGGDATQT